MNATKIVKCDINYGMMSYVRLGISSLWKKDKQIFVICAI